jgi:hypothetical protein
VDFCVRVVVHQRGAHRTCLDREPEALHEARRVHMAVADADTGACCGLGDGRRGDSGQIEADRRDALRQLCILADAVDDRPASRSTRTSSSDKPCS